MRCITAETEVKDARKRMTATFFSPDFKKENTSIGVSSPLHPPLAPLPYVFTGNERFHSEDSHIL